MALVGFIGGNISTAFLLPHGLLLAILALGYLCAFVGLRGIEDDLAYRVSLGMTVLGVLVILVAPGRSILPPLFYSWGWINRPEGGYFASAGFLLMAVGLLYACLARGLASDHRLAVLTRRELAAFFYSPIAYIVLIVFLGLGAVQFGIFAYNAYTLSNPPFGGQPRPMVEPIIQSYVISLFPVIAVILAVPLLTMKLLSEEKRTGTLEVLMTAPIDEGSVVLSKFLAALIFFLLLWLPWPCSWSPCASAASSRLTGGRCSASSSAWSAGASASWAWACSSPA